MRHLFHALPLPPTARQRRFACLLATLCLLGAASGFWIGRPLVGYCFGGLMVITPAILVGTGFCVPSFLYGLLFETPATCVKQGRWLTYLFSVLWRNGIIFNEQFILKRRVT